MSLEAIRKVADNTIVDDIISVAVDCHIDSEKDEMMIEVSSNEPDNLKMQLSVLCEGIVNILHKINTSVGEDEMIDELKHSIEQIGKSVFTTTKDDIKKSENIEAMRKFIERYYKG